jgi:broad specificity phosphatase PhoE
VGERLAREQPRVSRIVAGPRKRHLQTAQLLVEAARAAGGDYPDPVIEDDLDELPVRELVLAHGALHGLGPDLLQSVIAAVRAWAAGTLAPPGVLSPAEFVARVESAYRRLFPADGVAVVVTSGGPIAVSLLRNGALGDVGEAMMQGLQLANGSITMLTRELAIVPCDPVAHLAADEITQV